MPKVSQFIHAGESRNTGEKCSMNLDTCSFNSNIREVRRKWTKTSKPKALFFMQQPYVILY